MTPTLAPAPSMLTSPLGAFASYHTPPSSSAATLPEPTKQQVVTAEGLRHADNIVLDARQYKSTSFAHDILRLFATLRISSWAPSPLLTPTSIKIHKVSGSLTNAVFFISHAMAKTLLLRIYGPSSSSLISRPHELHTLHVLSSRYAIGPRVYGTFVNGRVEEHFESEALTPSQMRDPQVSACIGMRMAELHCVGLQAVVYQGQDEEMEGVKRNVHRWLGPAREVVRIAKAKGHPGVEELELERFAEEWEIYWAWLMRWERTHGKSERVFAHNDTQYGNLLRLRESRKGEADHHKIIVVDFEYASPNAAAYDIANHFHEWMADYHSDQPHELRREKYPCLSERRNFYIAYLTQARGRRRKVSVLETRSVIRRTSIDSVTGAALSSSMTAAPLAQGTPPLLVPTDEELDGLDAAVKAWSAASHGMWAVWGIVQAREDVEGCTKGEFDYLGYAASRMALFRELKESWSS